MFEGTDGGYGGNANRAQTPNLTDIRAAAVAVNSKQPTPPRGWPPAATSVRAPTWGTYQRSPCSPPRRTLSSSPVRSRLLPLLAARPPAPTWLARAAVECVCRLCLSQRAGDNIHALRPVAAGTGSQLLLYEVGAARLVASFRVFDGVRVHGIEPRSGGPGCPSYTLALFGERRVKLFSLGFGVEADGGEARLELELEQRLPGFDHWVLDTRFLEVPRLVRALTVESGEELFVFTNLTWSLRLRRRSMGCLRLV